jgi:hypothetical protein
MWTVAMKSHCRISVSKNRGGGSRCLRPALEVSALSLSTSIKAGKYRRQCKDWGSSADSEVQAMRPLPMHQSPRCGAHSRSSGKPCRNGAMKNGRCRMHGGKATGAPKGNKSAWKHGTYSTQSKVLRQLTRILTRN